MTKTQNSLDGKEWLPMELLWLSVEIIIIVFLVRQIYKPRYIQSLHYQLRLERSRLMEGEKTRIFETITNRGFLPFPVIQTTLEMAGKIQVAEGGTIIFGSDKIILSRKSSLRWFQKAIISYTLYPKVRGVYPIYCATFYYMDALRLSSHKLHLNDYTEMIVYPKVQPIDQVLPIPLNLFGEYFVRRWILEDYFFPSGVRDYVHGDNIRFIDWKKTAQNNQLKVRTYDYTNSNEVIIILNLQTTISIQERAYPERVEDIIHIGASILYEAGREGFAIGLFANGGCVGYTGQTLAVSPNQYQDLDQMYEYLARLRNFESMPFAFFLETQWRQLGPDVNIILVTGFINDEIYGSLRRLKEIVRCLKVVTLGEVEGKFQEGLPYYPSSLKGEEKIG